MKQIIVITIVLALLAFAIVACLFIFEIVSYENALSNLLKVEAAIILLGGCTALIALLVGGKKEPPN